MKVQCSSCPAEPDDAWPLYSWGMTVVPTADGGTVRHHTCPTCVRAALPGIETHTEEHRPSIPHQRVVTGASAGAQASSSIHSM